MIASTPRRVGHHVLLRASVAVLAFAAGCMDGPFPRVNPNDPAVEFTMQIVSSSDTLSPSRTRIVMQTVTQPVLNGFKPSWGNTPSPYVYHAGNGVFVLGVAPTVPTTVTVTASFEYQSASRNIVIMPTP